MVYQDSVWPDAEMKILTKVATAVFWIAQKHIFGQLLLKFCHYELSKIGQCGHTVPEFIMLPFFPLIGQWYSIGTFCVIYQWLRHWHFIRKKNFLATWSFTTISRWPRYLIINSQFCINYLLLVSKIWNKTNETGNGLLKKPESFGKLAI